ncbi:MAG: hypothetical protein ACRDCF_01385 [Mycoplasmoidaceae bacterium]
MMILVPDMSPFGQIWISDWLMYHHSDSMSIFRKLKIMDWNMFNGSNICYSMANVAPELGRNREFTIDDSWARY